MEYKDTFNHFPFARYTNDVSFQQFFRPSSSKQEEKKNFSGNHKLNGYKVEVSVLATRMAIGCTERYPGATSKFDMFKGNLLFRKTQMKKVGEERNTAGDNIYAGLYPTQWAFMVHKRYQGSLQLCSAVKPETKSQGNFLSLNEEHFNRSVSSDRIMVKTFLGRIFQLWDVLDREWKWSQNSFDMVFYLCFGLTNLHQNWKSPREADQ